MATGEITLAGLLLAVSTYPLALVVLLVELG
jgi:hypothetical protein